MTHEDFNKLCSAELRKAIEVNIDRKADAVALDKRVCSSSLVATQIKYLQRAKDKLPSYFEARCIIPPLSFEQSSSEVVASHKSLEGESLLDLTCGLGVDALHFSHSFRRVVTLERSPLLADVARENFRRMGVDNIEVVCSTAEEYLSECNERFDWIYADPDRRGTKGEKLVRLEDCSPNILALRGDIERTAGGRLMIKNSPLFDVDEAFRLFSPAKVEVVSSRGECKEVLVSTSHSDTLIATALTKGSIAVDGKRSESKFFDGAFDAQKYHFLVIPDVALQKARLVAHAFEGVADVWSNNGFGFCRHEPKGEVMGRIFEIEQVMSYNPKLLRREIGGAGIEILKRDFPMSVAQITKQLKIREGGSRRVAFTRIGEESLVIFLR